jgi:hypothetical protein
LKASQFIYRVHITTRKETFHMSAGRKPNKVSAPVIKAPPPVNSYEFIAPTGDAYQTWRDRNTQYSQNYLTPQTQTTIDASQSGLQGLARDLAQPGDAMVQNINQQSQNFYDLQAQNINTNSDALYSQTASDLAQRFGGAYNATFGALALDQLQKNRLNALYNAGKEATMYGQELYNQNQANQIDRFQVLNNYLNEQYNMALAAHNIGSGLLENEANRGQSLAITQAQLQQQAAMANQNAAQQKAQQRLAAIRNTLSFAGSGL